MKINSVEDLNQLYEDAIKIDEKVFAEMRSNILLVSGEHYSKRYQNTTKNNIRSTAKSTETLKLRITKNYTHRVSRIYRNAILSKAPGVTVVPANETQMQDQKDAQQNKSVIEYVNRRHKMKGQIRDWAGEFIDIGEVATKVYWDPNKGNLRGYEQKVTEDGHPIFIDLTGQETLNPQSADPMSGMPIQNQPAPDKTLPVYSGDLCFEDLFGFNLWRCPGSKKMEDSPYVGLRKMAQVDELKFMYADDKEKLAKIEKSTDTDYVIFDAEKAAYEKRDKWVLVREIYYKPCRMYPEGYYYVWTQYGILEQGTLPYGIFPIRWKAFDRYASTARGRSIIKVIRPNQAEINRASSQRATHGITLADDKILYQAGTKLAPGGLLPGVRGVTYQGSPPTILPGRTGDQFSGYINEEKADLFEQAMVGEQSQEKNNNLDPYSLLHQSMSQQAKYTEYIEKFEEFLVDVYELILELLRVYLDDQDLAEILGPHEQVNMAEFRKQTPQTFRISVEAQSDTIDTKLGKQITFQHLLQYIGNNLQPDQIGMIVRNMPFVNNEEMLSDLTVNYDNVKNDMLALERGEMPQMSPYDDSEYYVRRLTHRMKQADFRFLNPQVQQNYQGFMMGHQQKLQQEMEFKRQAEKGFIPTGGAMITVNMRMPKPDGSGTEQVRLPYDSVMSLIQDLEAQGDSLEKLNTMNQGMLMQMMGGNPALPVPAQQGRLAQTNNQQLSQQGYVN